DASVRNLKGEGRPLMPAEERAEILSALELVDTVTVFEADTAEELVDTVRPAIYVKGGDYLPDPSSARFPPEGRVVLRYGGEVRIVPYVEGRSTSDLLSRIREIDR